MKKEILCSISTKGRYDTTLALAISSVITQTKKPDYLLIQDDNDQPRDVREVQHYNYLFQILSESGIAWEWVYAEKKGQHYNHQRANTMGFKYVWRLDDDTIADSNVLETLYEHITMEENVGAVGGSVLTPPSQGVVHATGKIENIYNEPNLQWGRILEKKDVDHLHCSFLYRAGVANYCLGLSKVAHREETLFTYELRQKGYKLYVVPDAITWHLKNKEGGIRDGVREMFEHDEHIFQNLMNFKDQTIVILDCGMGDHIVFKKVLPYIKNPVLFTCYPEIIPGRSIAEAQVLFGDIGGYNVYAYMDRVNWKGSLESAFRTFYNVDGTKYEHEVISLDTSNSMPVGQLQDKKTPDLLRLNLGSGGDYIDGFVNVDLYAERADERYDIAKLPYPDNTVDEIRAYHVIEHFDFFQSTEVLKEWYRVLKPNGKIKLETPDFLESCREFVNTNEEGRWNLYGHFFSTAWINAGLIHKFLFTEKHLTEVMAKVGFRGITRAAPDSGYVHQHANKLIFLNLEATK